MTIQLSVNLNKIALLRNSREGNFPDVLSFGRRCLDLGVPGLTVHPRPDQRHIRASDIPALARLVRAFTNAEFNMEGNPFAPQHGDYPGFLHLVELARPHQCTLVPDGDNQLTSDHGFDLNRDGEKLELILDTLKQHKIRSSLFMDPIPEQIRLAKKIGADRIELYTGPYASAFQNNANDLESLFEQFSEAARLATELGLGVNAGHDLNQRNLPKFCTIPGLLEVSIGHALTVEALQDGWDNTVKAYLDICRTSHPNAH